MNRWEYPCDCPVDYPHLPIGPNGNRYVGCPFVWLTYNLISASPDYTPTATRRPYYQVAIALVRLALLTDSHPGQLEDIRATAGSMFQLAESLTTRVATTIQRPETLLGPQSALTVDYHRISTLFLWQVPCGGQSQDLNAAFLMLYGAASVTTDAGLPSSSTRSTTPLSESRWVYN